MEITLSKEVGRVAITVLRLKGQLDGQTYQDLIEKARSAYKDGSRDFLIDLSGLTYVSSAGLVALHTVALITNGQTLPDEESGWASIRSAGRAGSEGKQEHVKLYNPREEVRSVLDMVGFSSAFDIFDDLDKAVKSF
jgi:anti-anti-sigma regulatory factor